MKRTRLALFAAAIVWSASACASAPPAIVDVEHLNIYGANTQFTRDDDVPGGAVLRVKPRPEPGDEWASGSAAAAPLALTAGERLTGIFWARAGHEGAVTVSLHGAGPDYTALAARTIDLSPQWQRFVISGIAPINLAAGSQFLTLALGKAREDILFGPVMFTTGTIDETGIGRTFAAFRPVWVAEDLPIGSEPGVTLAATLRVPAGRGAGPFPAVLLLSGSGPSQRGGITRLQERLLRDGLAVLTYDKRGVGQSTGQFVDTLGNMATDAAAAIGFLRNRPDIDPKRIAIAGHSQGGAVGPAVAARDPGIAAVVILAGPAVSPAATTPDHPLNLVIMRDMLARSGASPAAIDQVSGATQRLFEARLANASKAEMDTRREQVIQGFIACRFDRSGAQAALTTLSSVIEEALNARFDLTLAKVHAPVLAIYGGKDEIVPAAEHAPVARRALAANAGATVVVLADLDHGLRHVQAISAPEQRYPGQIAAPEVIELVAGWLDDHLHPAGAKM